MKTISEHLKTYLDANEVKAWKIAFIAGDEKDKEDLINSSYGIFDGKVQGKVYTYYFYSCDTLQYKYQGTKNWHKGAKCYKVVYNFRSDELRIIPLL